MGPEGVSNKRGNDLVSPKKKSHLHRINNTNSTPLRIATGGMLATLVVGGGVAVAGQKSVTLDVNGDIIQANTMSGDVEGALKSAGVEVDNRAMVTPALNESISNNAKITVRSARTVALTIDGKQEKIDTTALTVGSLLDQLGRSDDISAMSMTRNQEIPLDGMELEIVTPKKFTLNDGGQDGRMSLPARTVGEIFEMRGTPLGKDDKVTPSADTPLKEGMHVEVTRIANRDETKIEDIPAPERVKEDPNLPEGEEKVVKKGAPGKARVVATVRTVNGKEVDRKEKSSQEITAPKERVIIRGTKKTPGSGDSKGSNTGASAPSVADGSVWDQLAMCESTGNWSINTGNGFSGGLQFTPSTWAGFGGTQYAPAAHMATREQQIDIAKRVQLSLIHI